MHTFQLHQTVDEDSLLNDPLADSPPVRCIPRTKIKAQKSSRVTFVIEISNSFGGKKKYHRILDLHQWKRMKSFHLFLIRTNNLQSTGTKWLAISELRTKLKKDEGQHFVKF